MENLKYIEESGEINPEVFDQLSTMNDDIISDTFRILIKYRITSKMGG